MMSRKNNAKLTPLVFVLWSLWTPLVFVVESNHAPVLVTALPDQAAHQGEAFSYSVASDAFTDPDAGDTLSYSATLADGGALPGWLSFNATTRTFSGTPSSVGTTSVKVTAKDAGNLSASDDSIVLVKDWAANEAVWKGAA